MHIYYIGSTCDDAFRTKIVIHSAYIFAKVLLLLLFCPIFFMTKQNYHFGFLLRILLVSCAESCLQAVHHAGSVRGL
jgi:hypothetical protein